MTEIALRAPAKINWSLGVTGRRPDGYHLLDMVIQPVSLWDTVFIRSAQELKLETDAALPVDERNIAYRAAQLFGKEYRLSPDVHIRINKTIPMQAGMAGGSADAAAVLEGLYRLYDIKADLSEKCRLGIQLGADVPVMLHGGLCRVRGIGEKVEHIPCDRKATIVLMQPAAGASTAEIFRRTDDLNQQQPDNEQLIRALCNGDFLQMRAQMRNHLQPVTEALIPEIQVLCGALMAQGAIATCMTGSGSAVYGVFSVEEAAQIAAENLEKNYTRVYVLHTLSQGVTEI